MRSKQEIDKMLTNIILSANAIRSRWTTLDKDQEAIIWEVGEDLKTLIEQLIEE